MSGAPTRSSLGLLCMVVACRGAAPGDSPATADLTAASVPADAAPTDAAHAPTDAAVAGPTSVLLDRTVALARLLNDRSSSEAFVRLSAAVVSVTTVRQCGRPKDWKLRSRSLATVGERRAWHRRVSARWGADCLAQPTHWCRWTDELSFDPTDVVCVGACCVSKSGASKAGMPTLTRACFDRDGKVEALMIADGCWGPRGHRGSITR